VGCAGVIQVTLDRGSAVASYAEVIECWRRDAGFGVWFNGVLTSAPFAAFRWETRPVSDATANDPFEFVVLDSPDLAREPDPDTFAEHFRLDPRADVLAFTNLGGDAIMVMPRPAGAASACGHLAAFVRNAPEPVVFHESADMIARVMMYAPARDRPRGASDRADGVDWLVGPSGAARFRVLDQENRILRQQRGGRRLCLMDDERRRLAVRTYPNGLCERLIGMIRRECVDWLIVLNEEQVRFVGGSGFHYNSGSTASLGPAFPAYRPRRFRIQTGITLLPVTESPPRRSFQCCITSFAWNRWRHKLMHVCCVICGPQWSGRTSMRWPERKTELDGHNHRNCLTTLRRRVESPPLCRHHRFIVESGPAVQRTKHPSLGDLAVRVDENFHPHGPLHMRTDRVSCVIWLHLPHHRWQLNIGIAGAVDAGPQLVREGLSGLNAAHRISLKQRQRELRALSREATSKAHTLAWHEVTHRTVGDGISVHQKHVGSIDIQQYRDRAFLPVAANVDDAATGTHTLVRLLRPLLGLRRRVRTQREGCHAESQRPCAVGHPSPTHDITSSTGEPMCG